MATLLNNESLTPTKLDPNVIFTPSNYPDGSSVIGAFRRAVQMALEDQRERNELFAALRKFETSRVVEDLMEDMKIILDHPEKRILYKYISPLIPQRLRGEYKSLVPHIPSFERKIIRLKLPSTSHTFGFTVTGGREYDCGIFVTNVLKSSKGAQANLKPGDQIVRLNGLILSECTHDEFVNLIKHKKSLVLTIKVVGLVPEKLPGSKTVTWNSVGEKRAWRPTTRIGVHGPIQSARKIQVTLQGTETLGASVKASSAVDGGVLILDIIPNSPADNAGLRRGDEIIHVNETSLIGMTLDEATRILRSSNMLMLTVKVDEPSTSRNRHSQESVPVLDYVAGPHDFDIDVETLSSQRHWLHEETGFVLRPRSPPTQHKKAPLKKTVSANRISVTDEDVEQSHLPPTIASPAAFGYGPAVAMPTILGLAQRMPDVAVDESYDFDSTLLTNEPLTSDSFSPFSPAPHIFAIGRATVEGQENSPPQSEDGDQDMSLYQFPSDDTTEAGHQINSALKKSAGQKVVTAKHPMFDDNVQIIPQQPQETTLSESKDITSSGVHPSNLSFSQDILQGRRVQFHTIAKDGPLKLAIRGGRDTPLGPRIIVSRIIEGGAAHRYGKLNVGDQILVCDGVSLIDVTHDEAGQAFKRAMDIHSRSIDLVVAVNPDIEEQ